MERRERRSDVVGNAAFDIRLCDAEIHKGVANFYNMRV